MATKIETIKKGSDFIAPRTKTSAITDSNDVSLDTLLSGKQSTLTAGQNISISNNTISATDTTYSNATTSASGLMSASDKSKLDGIESGAEVNTLEDVQINGTSILSEGIANLTGSNAPSIPLTKVSDVTATAAEVNYLSGVTSNVQTQINNKTLTTWRKY